MLDGRPNVVGDIFPLNGNMPAFLNDAINSRVHSRQLFLNSALIVLESVLTFLGHDAPRDQVVENRRDLSVVVFAFDSLSRYVTYFFTAMEEYPFFRVLN